MRGIALFLLLLLGADAFASTRHAQTPPQASASCSDAPLTQKDVVGLWSGSVRMPGRTDIWQFMPKFVSYQKTGAAVTIYLNNTVLFRQDGTFKFTVEDETTASQYEGSYTVKDAVLTMTFPGISSATKSDSGTDNPPITFSYPLSRWSDELMLRDKKEVGFQTLLRPLAVNWRPRKGSLIYQSPSGLMQVEITGGLTKSYHYEENGITHYADMSSSWHLVHSTSRHNAPLVKLMGVHNGVDFETLVVPLTAIPGLTVALEQIKASKTATGYYYTLLLLEVADTKPTQYVWEIRFDYQSGWEIDPSPLPPQTLYPSLQSSELRDWIAHLPSGTMISYAPRMHLLTLFGGKATDAADPEHEIADFAHYCQATAKASGIQFYENYNH